MPQEWLSGLSFLSIGNETARKIDFDLLNDSFAGSKSWKINFYLEAENSGIEYCVRTAVSFIQERNF